MLAVAGVVREFVVSIVFVVVVIVAAVSCCWGLVVSLIKGKTQYNNSKVGCRWDYKVEITY